MVAADGGQAAGNGFDILRGGAGGVAGEERGLAADGVADAVVAADDAGQGGGVAEELGAGAGERVVGALAGGGGGGLVDDDADFSPGGGGGVEFYHRIGVGEGGRFVG